jgi:hypothetical protein
MSSLEIYLVLYYIVQILFLFVAARTKHFVAGAAAAVILTSLSIHTVIMVFVFVYMMIYSTPWELKHTIAIVPFIIFGIVVTWGKLKRREAHRRTDVKKK